MTQATAHPDRKLISSEDVLGTDVYGIGDEAGQNSWAVNPTFMLVN